MKTMFLVYGLPASGKTTLATALYEKLAGSCLWINADKIRFQLNRDLGFSAEDRVEQARRIGALGRYALANSDLQYVIADFINPNVDTFDTFVANLQSDDFRFTDIDRCPVVDDSTVFLESVFMNTVQSSRYKDTDLIFRPRTANVHHVNHFLTPSEMDDLTTELVARAQHRIAPATK